MPDDESVLIHTVAARLLDLLAESPTLTDLYNGICELTVEVVPECTTTSLTIIREGAPVTLAALDDRAVRVDEAQYGAGDGPCLRAARTDQLVRIDDVAQAADPAEPWRRAAQEMGVRSTLYVPVPAGPDVVAGINIYGDRPGGWSEDSVVAAETLATYVGDALIVAYRMEDQSSARGGSARPWTMSSARSSSTRSPA